MAIWFKPYTLIEAQTWTNRFMVKYLGIEIIALDDHSISAKMPVDDRTKMPLGLLHGGASCVLAETLASFGSYLCINPETQACVGLDINANHLRRVTDGFVIGTATPVHLGKSTHVWEIKITTEENALVCISRMTMAVLNLDKV